jgi:phytoene dehydrogenase-like protein
MQNKFDVVIVGAGHNGMIAAAYLAKAGLDVAVFEKNGWVGGMSTTYEFIPGYKFSTGAMYFGALGPTMGKDLELYERGYKLFPLDPADPWLWAPHPDGKYYADYLDPNKTVAFLEKMFTKQDAIAYKKWIGLWASLAHAFMPMMMNPPVSLGDVLSMFRSPEEQAFIRRVLFYGLDELLDEFGFVSDGPKGYLAHFTNDLGWIGPKSPMSALACGMHYIEPVPDEAPDQIPMVGMPAGGLGPCMEIIAQVVRDRGGRIFLSSKVEKIIMKNGVASGVVVNGKEITAKTVISTLSPNLTLLNLIGAEHLDEETLDLIKTAKSLCSSAQIHFALNELPDYTCAPGKDPNDWQHRAAQVIAPSLEYAENCYDDWKHGIVSEHPTLCQLNESVFEPSMAPPGKFTAKVYVPAIPYHLKEGSWDDPAVKEDFANKVINTISEYAPNFRKAVITKYVFSPLDYERMFGNYNWGHVDIRPDQMFGYRPMPGWAEYKTPIEGLYLGGASCHGGPAVTGVPGHNVAHMLLENLGGNQK